LNSPRENNKHVLYEKYTWYVLLCTFNLIDFLTTKYIVDQDGFEAEFNMILKYFMNYMDSVFAILLFKGIFLIWLGFLVPYISVKLNFIKVLTFMFGLISINNFIMIMIRI